MPKHCQITPVAHPRCRSLRLASLALPIVAMMTAAPAAAQTVPPPSTVVSVCSGVSLPRSVVTDIVGPVVNGIYAPVETRVNGVLGVLSLNPLLNLTGLPTPLSVDVTGLLNTAASGSNIGLNVIAQDGTLVGPASTCNATADGFMLDTPAGIAIGGNMISGLGASGQQASAGEINSIAFGNRANTNALATSSIAIGPDASVGAGGVSGVALGSGASVTAANSVAMGAGSIAARGPLSNYTAPLLTGTFSSVGEVSIGAPGALRQLTNVAPGSAPTDAANIAQLQALAALLPTDPVVYDDPSKTVVTLEGAGGTRVTNVAAGTLSATSTDAVNGSQLYALGQQVAGLTAAAGNNVQYDDATQAQVTLGGAAGTLITNVAAGTVAAGSSDAVNGSQLAATNAQVTSNTTAIANLTTQVNANTGDINAIQIQLTNLTVAGGSPVQYSNPASPTTPNGGIPTNDVTIVGAAPGPVTVHNVAAGSVAAGSTDAVNGGQLAATNAAVQTAQTTATAAQTAAAAAQATADQADATANDALDLASNSVQYDSPQRTSVTLNPGGAATRFTNVATGTAASDAVNLAQLQAVATGAINTAVNQANAYTDARLMAFDYDLRAARREARAGSASALAAAALPQATEAGRAMISAGVGTYGGRNAIAIGASYASENGRTVFRLGISYDSNEKVGANAGVGFHL